MAHEVETMAWVNEVPWHGLGVKVGDNLTPMEMMKAAGLDWNVVEVETFAEYDGLKIPTGQKSLIRDKDHKVLTNVSDDWNPVQNIEAFEFFNEFVKAGNMKMDTAGSLNGGKNIWALAKIEDSFFDVFKGDVTECYLLFSNPHEYGKSINIRMTATRVVCNNTLSLSLNSKSTNFMKINHRSEFNPEMVKESMGIAHEKMNQYKEMAEFLGSKTYKKEDLERYYGEVFGVIEKDKTQTINRNAQLAMNIIDTQPGIEYAEGTWWQAFNAVTFMTNHVLGRSADTRMNSTWFGVNNKTSTNALSLAMDYAEKS